MKSLKKLFLVLSLVLLGLTSAFSQSLSGNWEGYLTVTVDQQEIKLPFKMVIKVDGTNNCEGQNTLWIEMDGKVYYATYAFKGKYRNNALQFGDYSLVNSTQPENSNFYWCEIRGTLVLSDNSLNGEVLGYSPKGDCLNAVAHLVFVSNLE